MTFRLGKVVGDAFSRLTTQAGVVLIGGLALFGTLRAAAGQDIVSGILERILAELQDTGFREDLGPQQLDAVETAEGEIEAYLADIPIALGLSPTAAALVWLLAYILGLVVIVLAIDIFAHKRDKFSGIETDKVGWKVVNLFLGSIVFGIMFALGLLFLVIPGLLVLVFLLFFSAAIVIDDDSFFEAFSSSVGVVKENFLSTIGLILVSIVTLVILAIAGSMIGDALPATEGAIADEVVSAVGTAFVLALLARAYMDATRGPGATTEGTPDDSAPSGGGSPDPDAGVSGGFAASQSGGHAPQRSGGEGPQRSSGPTSAQAGGNTSGQPEQRKSAPTEGSPVESDDLADDSGSADAGDDSASGRDSGTGGEGSDTGEQTADDSEPVDDSEEDESRPSGRDT